jgi:carboxymethylenebutenolidase
MKNVFFTMVLALLMGACNTDTEKTSQQKEAEGMAKFVSDKEFQEKHSTPEELDITLEGEMISFDTPDGKKGSAYAVGMDATSNNYLLVIHEWWGLNDHIKREADRLKAELGDVHVLALDIYDGKVATNRDEAGQYMGAVTEERANAIINGAINMAGKDAAIYTIGWCFGGGWSLRASIQAGSQGKGCVMYYGMPVEKARDLAPLKADVLCIWAEKDKWINEEVIDNFAALAKATGKDVKVKGFDADHAFANPSGDRYNEEAAQEANKLALNFLKKRMD